MFKFLFKCIFWTCLLVGLLALLAWFYPEKFLTVDSGPVAADVIIVIGGGGGQHERADRAGQLYRLQAAPRLILTGAGDEQINRHRLLAAGVPDRVMQLESRSRTTWENAAFTGELLRAGHVHSAILVTSWYHARRVERTFAHVVPEVKFYSRPSYSGFDRSEWGQNGLNRRMRLEFLKLPGYWIRYGICPF